MQVTVTVPDELAVQAQAQGLSPDHYIEQWAANQAVQGTQIERDRNLSQFKSFFVGMSARSENVPLLADEALTRDSFYQDHG